MNLKNLWGALIVLLIIALPVFGHLSELAIQTWDESRLAVNAFEMFKTRNWWVTTFMWQPDMWNTKPPLLIWLQVASLKIFGINELAIRIPSAIAAVITCLFMYWFLVKRFQNKLLAIAAPAILIVSEGYTRLHGIRTGDYDALLTMFTTMYILYFYLYLKEFKPRYLLLTAVTLTLACLTKGIHALIFMPALLALAIYYKRLPRILTSWAFYTGLVFFIVIIPGYYLLREYHNPGYLAAVAQNELGGRFFGVLENHREPAEFYFMWLYQSGAMWLLLYAWGMNMSVRSKSEEIRNLAAYLTVAALSFLVIISFAETKLFWYVIPTYPLLSILAAIAVHSIFTPVPKSKDKKYIILVVSAVIVYLLAYNNILNNVLKPQVNKYDRLNAIIEYIKEGMAGKRDIRKAGIVYGEYQQDIIWYEHVCDGISYKNFQDFKQGEHAIVRTDEAAAVIRDMYDCELVHDHYGVKIYEINGWKKKTETEADTLK
ncbi:MAG: glycosyltransferase family 39 protein [Chitinophagaceae bacterium]|nr:glycosyltransferase family 39 protein [Chitinophagaceae bacterium]